ncbi:MAG: C4-dicarboxylate ABC transporter, partial [Alcaligenaceae bacterium]|nr:C4-dicarboxylate ABC transporter [Alcaligenaceae bacterium]
GVYPILAGILLLVLNVIILLLAYRTLLAVKNRQICQPEP